MISPESTNHPIASCPYYLTWGIAILFLFQPVTSVMSADIDYSSAISKVESIAEMELRKYGIGGISVALIDAQRIVHVGGYGNAKPDSIYRAGSISKLFNAIAVMQLVEAGKLDLDAPFGNYPGAILPVNPFPDAGPITFRQLLSHRSGLQRESPIGGYLDISGSSLEATCQSVKSCVLVNPPNTKTRYSNIAPSLAGRVVATVSGQSFEEYQRQNIFMKLGMTRSAWLLKDLPSDGVIPSGLIVADGVGGFTHQTTPSFDLGTVPAGNLFTTAPDLARFVVMLDAKGMGHSSRVLLEKSLAEMSKPQFDPNGSFGIGFALGRLRDHQTIGHSGAVYGHSTALTYLPNVRLGAVVIANEDIVNPRVNRIMNAALSAMLETKTGEKPPVQLTTIAMTDHQLAEFAGSYESQSFWAEFHVKDGRLEGSFAYQPCTLVPTGENSFLLNSRIHDDVPVTFVKSESGTMGFTAGVQKFTRVPTKCPEIPDDWKRYLGSYGPKIVPVVIHEKFGHLYATTENMVDYRLTPVNRHVFRLPLGMYDDEHVVFLSNLDQSVHSIDFANMVLPRLR